VNHWDEKSVRTSRFSETGREVGAETKGVKIVREITKPKGKKLILWTWKGTGGGRTTSGGPEHHLKKDHLASKLLSGEQRETLRPREDRKGTG